MFQTNLAIKSEIEAFLIQKSRYTDIKTTPFLQLT